MAIEWVIGRNKTTGLLFLADGSGGRFDFDTTHAAGIAVALSDYCRNNDERAFVRSEWCELDDEDLCDHGRTGLCAQCLDEDEAALLGEEESR
jgi:hypothetical protein